MLKLGRSCFRYFKKTTIVRVLGEGEAVRNQDRSSENGEIAVPSSTLAWEIPWMEEPGGLRSWGCKESDNDSACCKKAQVVK